MPSAGFLIYSGVMPLLKTFLSIIIGYVLARMELFPKASSKGASQVTMNVALPLLIFSNIVPAFTPQNISAIGPMFLLAYIYQAFGFLLGLVIREIFYVPRNFWQGIVVMSGLSNWGNLPNAIVLSVAAQAPFDPATDPALGVSFVAIFIVAYHLTFWVGGAAHSLSWDYLPHVPQGEAAEVHLSWNQKPIGSLVSRYILKQSNPVMSSSSQCTITQDDKEKALETTPFDSTVQLKSENPNHQLNTIIQTSIECYATPSPSPTDSATNSPANTRDHDKTVVSSPLSVARRILQTLSSMITPITIALIVSLPIAVIQPLKALFVDVSDIGGPQFKGPDGRPPLAFLIDTADFIGALAVPLALILLGASFARLSVPRPFSRLPLMAMAAVAVAKMVIMPVIGVLVVKAMIKRGLIHNDLKVEKFVAMLLSGSPSAVNQLIVASLYSPDGNVDTLAAFLLVQYIFMFISSSALTAVAILLS